MAELRQMADFEYDDDDKLDHMLGMPAVEPPDYPSGMKFTLTSVDLAKICTGDCSPGMTLNFAAMGTAMSVEHTLEGCRIEVELSQMAGEDGKFTDLDMPPFVCLCGPELAKLDLDEDCERGDTIHLIGMARVERTSQPQYGGDSVTLQITQAYIEDESGESRYG